MEAALPSSVDSGVCTQLLRSLVSRRRKSASASGSAKRQRGRESCLWSLRLVCVSARNVFFEEPMPDPHPPSERRATPVSLGVQRQMEIYQAGVQGDKPTRPLSPDEWEEQARQVLPI